MRITKKTKVFFLNSLLALSYSQSHGSATLVPEINPTSRCMAQDVKVPHGDFPKYRYLRDSDCKGIFVLPPSRVVPEVHFTSAGKLGLCKGVKINIKRQNDTEEAIDQLRQSRNKLQEQLITEESQTKIAKIEKKIETIKEHIDLLVKERLEDKTYLDVEYGKEEGGSFQVFLNNEIDNQDLMALGEYNEYPITLKDNEGNDVQASIEPVVVPAPVTESYYSFRLRSYTPENPQHPTIISTDIPGLEKLQQIDSTTKYTHVVGGDVLSGEMVMNLPAVCEQAVETPNGYVLSKEGKAKTFAINRTMVVNKKFTYGYKATLNSNEVATVIAEDFVLKGNYGASVDQTFKQTLGSNLDSYLSFKWTVDYETEKTIIDSKEVEKIKEATFARMVSKYYEGLVAAGKLTPQVPTEAGQGKVVPIKEFAKGWGCGPVDVGGVTFDHDGCGAYDFTLTTYHSGMTDKDITNTLILDQDITEEFVAESMAPFHYTTAFTFAKDEDKKEGELQ